MNETARSTCDYSKGLQETTRHHCGSQTIRVEPLIHWGTVTPTAAFEVMVIFRRDGGFMQEPAYKQLVRRLVEMEAPSYCTDCLEYLWSKRAEARDTTRQLVSAPSRASGSSRAYQTDMQQIFEEPADHTRALAVGGTTIPIAHLSRPFEAEEDVEASMVSTYARSSSGQDDLTKFQAPFQLDGTFDSLNTIQARRTSEKDKQSHVEVWVMTELDNVKHSESVGSSSRSSSFTHPLRDPPTPKIPDGPFLPTVQQPCTKTPHSTKRKFGREIDTNAVTHPVQLRRSPRKHTKNTSMSRDQLYSVSVKPMKPLKPLKKPEDVTKPTKKRKNTPSDKQASKQKKPRITSPKVVKPASSKKCVINVTAGTRILVDTEPEIPPPASPELSIHDAKRPVNMEIPDDVDELTWEAFDSTNLAPTSKICICHKPASHVTRKGEQPQVAKCANRDCRFKWYHYTCLNQSQKMKARRGTFVCQHCQNEDFLAEQDKTNSWSTETVDFRTDWTQEDIEARLPGTGGHPPLLIRMAWVVRSS